MFQTTQSKIHNIGEGGVNPQEEPVKRNLKCALASQLQDQSVEFRRMQKQYLQSEYLGNSTDGIGLKGNEMRGQSMFSIQEDITGDDSKFDVVSFLI